MKVLDMAAVWT